MILNNEPGPLRQYLDERTCNLRATPDLAGREWGGGRSRTGALRRAATLNSGCVSPCTMKVTGPWRFLSSGSMMRWGLNDEVVDDISRTIQKLKPDEQEELYEQFSTDYSDVLPAVGSDDPPRTSTPSTPELNVPDHETILEPPDGSYIFPRPAETIIKKANQKRRNQLGEFIRRWRQYIEHTLGVTASTDTSEGLFTLCSVQGPTTEKDYEETGLIVKPPRPYDRLYHLRFDESYEVRPVVQSGPFRHPGRKRFMYNSHCELVFTYELSTLFGDDINPGDNPNLCSAVEAIRDYERRFIEAALMTLWD